MNSVPPDVLDKVRAHDQEHVLAWWDHLEASQRVKLVEQLRGINFEELKALYGLKEQKTSLPEEHRIAALPRPEENPAQRRAHLQRGEEEFRRGRVAFLVVAGGQGSRLGFEHPKGMFPVGPVSGKSLFQIHTEKIVALRRRFGAPLPFLVMTSPATDEETRHYFQEHHYFGLPAEDVIYFCQGTMPALDLKTGKILLESKAELFLGPNGHGGTLTGLADSGLLDDLDRRGIRTVSYFQVDNPLVDLADRVFLGQHVGQKADVSSKVIPKEKPTDKLGNFVLVDGRCSIIEYSDLPEALAIKSDAQGRLLFWAGNPAIHLFDVAFLRKVTQGAARISWHLARKKVPCLDAQGRTVEPAKENALKFERFIFDVLPQAERWTAVATSKKEFEPLKNATGPDSPATVRQALCDQAADWLEHAGLRVPRDPKGGAEGPLEISPLYALDAEELAAKVDRNLRVEKGLYLQ
ncbi:MAG TPA: UDPGP type 1 family protein [Gemmataceae bacterium]|jgi:UDP-N-acetylglucosamine/UDP-N-acetylgalactosamine diphosphorylase|nr:UDPGP type 1 family protein [Gemmataceae bacterium]